MDLSIVIVNYKSRDKLLNCLKSIAGMTSPDIAYEVIVVDNASGDDLSGLMEVYPELQLIESPNNLGMGGGNNLGITAAQAPYVFILNPDTVIQGEVISVLFNYLKAHPTVGLVGPKLLYPDGSLQLSCSRFPSFFMPLLRRTFLGEYFKTARDRFTMTDFDHNSIKPVDWLMGSSLMFRKEIALADGSQFLPRFDERYFMYFEDIDLARQFWTNGFQVVYNPEAVIIHDHQRQSAKYPWYIAVIVDRSAWWHIQSWLNYFAKWGLRSHKNK